MSAYELPWRNNELRRRPSSKPHLVPCRGGQWFCVRAPDPTRPFASVIAIGETPKEAFDGCRDYIWTERNRL